MVHPSDLIVADIPHYSFAEQIRLPSIIRSAHADLFLGLHFNIPFFCPVPFVATIHDLILHRYPNTSSVLKKMLYRMQMRHGVRRSVAVLTVSDFVSTEIAKTYGEDLHSKMTVIYEGIDECFFPRGEREQEQVLKKYHLTKPYFLYVGNAKPHKNVPLLIEAFSRMWDSSRELVLLSGGKEIERLSPLPAGVRRLAGVPIADLPALYSAALSFVTLSTYEGFCLPVAEALACGCPVIAADRGPIPEIARGHALLVEPELAAVIAALNHPPLRREPFLFGTWKQPAQRACGVLRAVLGKSAT